MSAAVSSTPRSPIGSSSFPEQESDRCFMPVSRGSKQFEELTEIFNRILTPLYGSQDKALQQIAEGKDRKAFLLYEGRDPMGVLVFKTQPSEEFNKIGIKNSIEIKSLFVDNAGKNSGRGLGTTLLQKLVEEAGPQKTGCSSYHVTVSQKKKDSMRFFNSNGFDIEDVWDGKYEKGINEFLLACPANQILKPKNRKLLVTENVDAQRLEQLRLSSGSVISAQGQTVTVTLQKVSEITNAHWEDIHVLKMLSDGTFISGSKDNTIRKWKVDGTHLRTIQEPEPNAVDLEQGWITAIGVINDEYWIGGERNGRVRLWNTAGDHIRTLAMKLPRRDGHVSKQNNLRRVNCLTPGYNKQKMSFFVGFPTLFDEFNIVENRTITSTKAHNNDWVYCIHPLSEEKLLTVVAGTLEVWKRQGIQWKQDKVIVKELMIKPYTKKREHISVLTPLEYSSNYFGLGVFGGKVQVVDVEAAKVVKEWKEHQNNIWALENITNTVFASSGDDGKIKLWDIRVNESISTIVEEKTGISALLRLSNTQLVAGTSSQPQDWRPRLKSEAENQGARLIFYDIRK